MRFCLFKDGDSVDLPEGSVILVKASGETSQGMDVRKINGAFETTVNPEGVLGASRFSKKEAKRSESLSGDPSEIASILTRRIKRMTR